MDGQSPHHSSDQDLPLLVHLAELRSRLIHALIASALAGLVCYMFADPIMLYAQAAISPALPSGKLVFISPVESFLVQLKFSFFLGLLFALPYVLYQAWAFVYIALYPNEKRFLMITLLASLISFYAGGSFSWFVALPFAIRFLVVGTIFTPMISVDSYFSFLIFSTLVFGVIFQTPLVIYTGYRSHLLSIDFLRSARRYAILVIFVLAGVFSPPDVFSQFLVAMPMLLLYELGILLCRIFPGPGRAATDNPGNQETEVN